MSIILYEGGNLYFFRVFRVILLVFTEILGDFPETIRRDRDRTLP